MRLSKRCTQFSWCTTFLSKLLGRKGQNVAILSVILFTAWILLSVDHHSVSRAPGTSLSFRAVKGAGDSQPPIGPTPATLYLKDNVTACAKHFAAYGGEFARLRDVTLDPSKNVAFDSRTATAGDKHLQSETSDVVPIYGYFSVFCKERPLYHFKGENHLNTWMASTRFSKQLDDVNTLKNGAPFTIAVKRYEYANFFHSMTDFYNAFLMLKFFRHSPEKTTILLVDGHPPGMLFDVWTTLFKNVTRAVDIRKPVLFKELVWSIVGYNSPMTPMGVKSLWAQLAFSLFGEWTPFWIYSNPLISYLSEFKKFFLGRYDIKDYKNLNCKNISVLFIWRRDYVAHRGNPSGLISRKIKNEKELLQSVKALLPQHHIEGVQLDSISIKNQLRYVSQADIMIGMHGAGLTHTLFLPDHAALLELYPRYWPTTNVHFRCMAKWRNLTYFSWQNTDHMYEKKNYYTYIPPLVLLRMVQDAKNKICS